MSASQPSAGELASRCVELINTGRGDLAGQVCAPDFVTIDPHGHDHGPQPGARGPELFAAVVTYLNGLFADLHVEVTETFDVGDRAATIVQLDGRYRGPESAPGAGQPVTMRQVHFWYARAGKLTRHTFLENDADFERQFG